MPRVRVASGIEIEHELSGPERGEPLLLIMGLGAQLVHWPLGLVRALEQAGFRVIRFDNRDAGGSTHLSQLRAGNVRKLLARRLLLGLPVTAPYTLSDMAADAAGLLDALGVRAAHVVGASLGGMIAQTLALTRPERVKSLTSIMSSTGARRHLVAMPSAALALLSPPAKTREQAIESTVRAFRALRGRGMSTPEAELRETAALAFERGHDPRGVGRQLAAILASGDRTQALGRLRRPAAVIHGSDDPLILPGAGRATARAIPGARFALVRGMGHELPAAAWPAMVEAVAGAAGRV